MEIGVGLWLIGTKGVSGCVNYTATALCEFTVCLSWQPNLTNVFHCKPESGLGWKQKWPIHFVYYVVFIVCLNMPLSIQMYLCTCLHTNTFVCSLPLSLSERWGWLLRALGSPCVAQRVWARPKCVDSSSSRSSKSFSEHTTHNTNTLSLTWTGWNFKDWYRWTFVEGFFWLPHFWLIVIS